LANIAERLQELEADIQRMARRWARDCPDDWEDLAQEARLAIYQQLKQDPETPRSHLMQHAKSQIVDYRELGKSVDGKLDRTYHRTTVWRLASLDASPEVVGAEYSGLYFRSHRLRPVEDLALDRVTYGELRQRLTGQQAQYLSLRGHDEINDAICGVDVLYCGACRRSPASVLVSCSPSCVRCWENGTGAW
jgi:DNA-directed RNA polymerase specialized sigma24 family protein